MNKYIVIVKKDGGIVKFLSSEIPVIKRGSVGVKATVCREGDAVVSAFVLEE